MLFALLWENRAQRDCSRKRLRRDPIPETAEKTLRDARGTRFAA